VILLALSKTAAAESNFWDVLQKQVTEDEMKSFILYVQELEAENTALQNKISVLEESLEETRQRVIKLEELVETRDGEIKLLETNSCMRTRGLQHWTRRLPLGWGLEWPRFSASLFRLPIR